MMSTPCVPSCAVSAVTFPSRSNEKSGHEASACVGSVPSGARETTWQVVSEVSSFSKMRPLLPAGVAHAGAASTTSATAVANARRRTASVMRMLVLKNGEVQGPDAVPRLGALLQRQAELHRQPVLFVQRLRARLRQLELDAPRLPGRDMEVDAVDQRDVPSRAHEQLREPAREVTSVTPAGRLPLRARHAP